MQRQRVGPVLIAVVLGLTLAGGQAGDAGHQILLMPTDLQWVENPTRPGQRSAPILGDQLKPGPYVRRVRFPPNTVNPPHSHPDDRQVTILVGTWYLGHGSSVDTEHATKAVAETVFTDPAYHGYWVIPVLV